MSDYLIHLTVPENLVFLAAAIQAAALLFRGQIRIRVLLLTGSGVYLAYYMLAAKEPLWEAMIATLAMALANIYGLVVMMLSNKIRSIPSHQISLFSMFDGVEPCEFRTMMSQGEIQNVQVDKILTTAGEMPDNLYFVIHGDVDINQGLGWFRMPAGHFIGEVSIMLGTTAPATVCVRSGAQVVVWPREKLMAGMERHVKLKAAMTSLLGRDMARKIAVGNSHGNTGTATVVPAVANLY
ncbi:MAG: cyclic nucleotide-binding domain-containing protein [Stappiaceae bacterium]